MIETVGENDSVVLKAAKDIVVGDEIWSYTWDTLKPETDEDPLLWTSSEMSNVSKVKSTVVHILPSFKDVTMFFNDKDDARLSLEHSMIIKRNGVYMFASSGSVEIGDYLLEDVNGTVSEVEVTSINMVDDSRTVYKFDAAPYDIIIAGGLVTHNAKYRF
jgi:hypothetical protein